MNSPKLGVAVIHFRRARKLCELVVDVVFGVNTNSFLNSKARWSSSLIRLIPTDLLSVGIRVSWLLDSVPVSGSR
ncbi:hypothetical protein D3C77_732580 [compost metagenome]